MELRSHWKPLVRAIKTELDDRADEIDPTKEHDWYDLVFGWALAKGLEIEDARNFSTYIRYNTDLC